MASFTESFTGTDHANLGNGWVDDSGFGGSDPIPKYLSNRGSTDNNTTNHVALKAHGLTVSGDWQIDFDCLAPLVIGEGGCGVAMVSNATFQGWGLVIANAVHVQKFAIGGSHTNITNIDRPGSTGSLQNHVTFTHRGSDGFMEVFLDSVSFASTTDNTQSAGNTVYLQLQNTNSPTTECWIDNLVISDAITGPPAGDSTAPSTIAATTTVPSATCVSRAFPATLAVAATVPTPVKISVTSPSVISVLASVYSPLTKGTSVASNIAVTVGVNDPLIFIPRRRSRARPLRTVGHAAYLIP